MARNADLLTPAFRRPESVLSLDPAGWDLLVRQARRAQLLARLAALLEDGDLIGRVPAAPRLHLESARTLARKYVRDVRWEATLLGRALATVGEPLILLKGAAYALAGLPAAEGRLFSDIDILAPRDRLADVEHALDRAGWRQVKDDQYDQSYYRRWMHELPPMTHIARNTSLDVHHTILPLTARPRIDAARIIAAAIPAPGAGGALVLAPEDMALHAAAHCFYDGFFQQGLRELVDIASLLRQFGAEDGFWSRLTQRARELDLERTLWYALRYVGLVLDQPAPASAVEALGAAAPAAPVRCAMDALVLRALRPDHASIDGPGVRASRFLLYIRSHYLRMPLSLLLPHLARKATMRLGQPRKTPA